MKNKSFGLRLILASLGGMLLLCSSCSASSQNDFVQCESDVLSVAENVFSAMKDNFAEISNVKCIATRDAMALERSAFVFFSLSGVGGGNRSVDYLMLIGGVTEDEGKVIYVLTDLRAVGYFNGPSLDFGTATRVGNKLLIDGSTLDDCCKSKPAHFEFTIANGLIFQ